MRPQRLVSRQPPSRTPQTFRQTSGNPTRLPKRPRQQFLQRVKPSLLNMAGSQFQALEETHPPPLCLRTVSPEETPPLAPFLMPTRGVTVPILLHPPAVEPICLAPHTPLVALLPMLVRASPRPLLSLVSQTQKYQTLITFKTLLICKKLHRRKLKIDFPNSISLLLLQTLATVPPLSQSRPLAKKSKD